MKEPRPGAPRDPSARGAAISLRAVTKQFGRFVAVDSVDLDIGAGEFLTLLGPSGSGKTTILNMLAGFLHPDSGEIRVDGQPIDPIPPHKRGFGMVFQNYALFPNMTVADNVAFPLRMRGVQRTEATARATATLGRLRLGEQAAKMPSQLSGGQQQRVALARTLVYEPRVILMDEPLSALDRRLREALQLELKELHRSIGSTIVYVTHDQGEALTMSDRVAVLNSGTVLAIGPPRALYEAPPHPFVSSFLGESNRLSGRVTNADATSIEVTTDEGWLVTSTGGTGSLRPDQRVSVAIRPERIRLSARAEALGHEGHVESALFLGEIVRYEVQLEGGPLLQVRIQNERGHEAPGEGDRVALSWDPADVRILCEPD